MDTVHPILESIPNFSTSDPAVVARIVAAAKSVPGVRILDSSSDRDHNRAVVTLAGAAGPLVDGLLAACRHAIAAIDLRRHRGAHPRIGAVDVVPFVPLGGSTEEEAKRAALEFARRLNTEAGVPVFFYGALAADGRPRDLHRLRLGGFEGLAGRMAAEPPDVGRPEPHPTAGATAVGVRGPLIAFNVLLAGGDLEAARRIARRVRASSGGLPGVQAMGIWLESGGRAQVSMNLTDPEGTPPHVVVRRLRELAREEGLELDVAELVGLMPFAALAPLVEEGMLLKGFGPERILECRL